MSEKNWYQVYNEKAVNKLEHILEKFNIEYLIDGDNFKVRCPIHNSSSVLHSSIRTDGVWMCWSGDCSTEWGKTALGFVRALLSMNEDKKASWHDVINFIDSDDISVGEITYSESKENKIEFQDESVHPEVKIPSIYYINRGFDGDVLKKFNIGDCSSGPYGNRAIVPVRYINGEYMGFSGRSHFDKCPKCEYYHNKYSICVDPKDKFSFMFSKWLHKSGTKKSKTLYNIENIKNLNTDKVAIVEGTSCVWRLFSYNIHCVASLGRDFNKERVNLLKQCGINKVLFISDNDKAGQDFKSSFIKEYNKDFIIYLPKLTAKDPSEMSDADIKKFILSKWENM